MPARTEVPAGIHFSMVGAKGFEPSTLWSQTRCATRLRYSPTPLLVSDNAPVVKSLSYKRNPIMHPLHLMLTAAALGTLYIYLPALIINAAVPVPRAVGDLAGAACGEQPG